MYTQYPKLTKRNVLAVASVQDLNSNKVVRSMK